MVRQGEEEIKLRLSRQQGGDLDLCDRGRVRRPQVQGEGHLRHRDRRRERERGRARAEGIPAAGTLFSAVVRFTLKTHNTPETVNKVTAYKVISHIKQL